MSERKVLNKYYPPDFDPTKIPRLKRPKNRQFNIRIMAPFNMRCATCGEYIYKGKKFNSRQEKVEDETYLGLMIFRFYIKCPRCVSEISFKTDPQNCDYSLEGGAIRNFEALRTAEKQAEAELKEKEEDEKNNPMKVLENRTKASQQEMEMLETLEELREINSRHAKLDHESVLKLHKAYEEQLRLLQDEEDEQFIRSVFGKGEDGAVIKRIHDDDDDDGESSTSSTPKVSRLDKPSDILTETAGNTVTSTGKIVTAPKPKKQSASWEKSVGSLSQKKSLLGIVKKKQLSNNSKPTECQPICNSDIINHDSTESNTNDKSCDEGTKQHKNNLDELTSTVTDKISREQAVLTKPVSSLPGLCAYSGTDSDGSDT